MSEAWQYETVFLENVGSLVAREAEVLTLQ
jgi:hypothetical protein